ncbi:MAG: DNA polymerase III subunit gamma/tau [Gammaproteobacteria bacterium]|nr:DNA polymerase III subunit gamma/tau [Gammaproteobacteria bacterium]
MPYQALARKWRPKRFNDVVGQAHVIQALSHALTNNKLHHAYLFTGTHGTGKTTLARIFAKCLNCETGITATPCDQCSSCQEIDSGRFPDLYEIDAASRTKVEDTRELLDNIPYAPTKGKFKIYLIDEVHMLSTHSFNALLKTLEEPPEHVKFLLATTDPQKLPATVLSRCLQFHLSKMIPEQIEKQLAHILVSEKIDFEAGALALISTSSNGSMRDSLSLLDQCIAYGNGKITTTETQSLLGLSDQTEITTLLKAIHENNAQAALSLTQKWADNGIHFSRCLSELLTQLYQITVLQFTEGAVFNAANPELKNMARALSPEDAQLYYQIALIGQRDLPLAPTAQIGFEMIVMRIMAFTITETKAQTKPLTSTHAHVSTATTTVKNDVATSWNTLLSELKLAGPTLALAQHCNLRELKNGVLQLSIQPKYSALLNTKHQERIEEAFAANKGEKIKVTITIEKNKENMMDTPADMAVRAHEADKQSAKIAISADPSIHRIVTTFDAKLLEDSIEPLK